MNRRSIVSREEWLAARVALLKRGKELTRLRDQRSATRCPGVRQHDRYDAGGFVDPTGRYVAPKQDGACCGSSEKRS